MAQPSPLVGGELTPFMGLSDPTYSIPYSARQRGDDMFFLQEGNGFLKLTICCYDEVQQIFSIRQRHVKV